MSDEKEKTEKEENFEQARIRWAFSQNMILYGTIALAVIAVIAVALLANRFWKYSDYKVMSTKKQEDTLSSSYLRVGDYILKYDAEGAQLMELDGSDAWDIQYSMQDPQADVCENLAAVYDENGTDIVICDQTGRIGGISTDYPIIKAEVSGQGDVAVIEKDENVTWINYYDKKGKTIASIKTSIDSPGYPLDIAISHDGQMLAVSYLAFDNGNQKGVVDFYNFGSSGQNQMDNRVAEFEYNDRIVAELDYMDGDTCVAFRDNGFSVFSGSKVPEKKKDVTFSKEIASTLCDDSNIGVVLGGESEEQKQLQVYSRSGNRIMDKTISTGYSEVEMNDGEIDFYANSQFSVYSRAGIRKYEGTYKKSVKKIFSLGDFRFAAVTDDSIQIFKLH